MGLSKRQFRLQCGMNQRLLDLLIQQGVLVYTEGKLDMLSLSNLQEGAHYIKCMECGAYLASVGTKHLRVCAGIDLGTYRERYPEAPCSSEISTVLKKKTPAQKEAQSLTLRKRFQTEKGAVTRQQISEAACCQMLRGYRERAALHLRRMGEDPLVREHRSKRLSEDWLSGSRREIVTSWHRNNPGVSLKNISEARRHLQKTSRLHLHLKEAMVKAGVAGFMTEYPVGFYSVDEAHPQLKIAVEVDGCYWHGCEVCGFQGVGDILQLDQRKTTYLVRRGWRLLRFPEHVIKRNMEEVICAVLVAVSEREGV